MTTTMSPCLMFRAISGLPVAQLPVSLDHFGGQRDDLHEVLLAKLAGDRTEYAGALGVILRVDDDRRVLIEADVAAIDPAIRLLGADDHALDDVALLHVAGRQRLLDDADDHIAHA